MSSPTSAPEAPPITPEPLMHMMQGLQATGILKAGIELSIFDHIDAGKRDAASIAVAAGADERGVRILLDALAALGLLETNGAYGLSPLADAFLVSSRPAYLGSFVHIIAGEMIWEAYANLADAVRAGRSVLDEGAETPGHTFWETFAQSSTGIAAPASHALAEVLAPWASGRDSLEILDIACGTGLYGLTLGQQFDQARVTLLDWPNVLAITRGTVEQMGLADRTSYIEGDVFEAPLGGPYDLIVASHIFHHFSEERCVALMRRLAAALRPDGRLAINEFAAAGLEATADPFPRLFSVIMLVWTQEGEAYPVASYERMLGEAGFGAPEVHEGRGMPSRFLIAGLK